VSTREYGGTVRTAGLLVGDIFRRNATTVPNRTAVSLEANHFTFRTLDEMGNRYARVLREAGLRHGDRISWWADAHLNVAPVAVAAAKLGLIIAPLNAVATASELAPQIDCAEPALILANGERIEDLTRVTGSIPVACLDEGSEAAFSLPDEATLVADADVDEPLLRESDPYAIYFTSGTSGGRPKGALVSQRVTCLRSFAGVNPANPGTGGTFLCTFPQYHMGGWHLSFVTWQDRQAVAWIRRADADVILRTIEEHRVNRVQTLPAIWRRILDTDRSPYDLSSIRLVETGTSPTSTTFLAELREAFPHAVNRVWYGSTEAGSCLVLEHDDLFLKPDSVGTPLPGMELQRAPSGELLFRSEFNFSGYRNDPEQTDKVLQDGWYHSGDVGIVDDEGYVTISGRLTDAMRTGGEWVMPNEIDAVLQTHPSIKEISTIGVPDPSWGEVVCAVVVLHPGESLTLEELRGFCGGRLASFKQPRRLEFRDELPRTPATGKVMRAALIEEIVAAENLITSGS
jgi:fatty-acyl-CoA synthase